MQTFWIGISLALVASFCASLGLAWLRLSHKKKRNPCSTFLWYGGYALQLLAALFDVASFGFAPVSLLSCMGAMTLVFNLWLAPMLCGEVVSLRDCKVNCIVFMGTILSLYFGPHETPTYSLEQLYGMMTTTESLIYLISLCSWIGTLVFLWSILKEDDVTNNDNTTTTTNNANNNHQNHNNRKCSNWNQTTRARVLRLLYPVIAGSFGGNTVLCAKACVSLVQTTWISGENQFWYGGTYLIFYILTMCLGLQLYFLDGGMNRYDAVFVVPIYVCFWITSGILGAMFFLQEVTTLSTTDIVCFTGGVCLSLFGILLHSTRPPSNNEDDNDDDNDSHSTAETKEEDDEKQHLVLHYGSVKDTNSTTLVSV